MIETEVQMEAIRQSLRERKNFDVGKAFHIMAANQRAQGEDRIPPMIKYLTARDLESLMIKHEHFHDLEKKDILLLISRFDKDNDGRIGINEFYDQMEPQSKRSY